MKKVCNSVSKGLFSGLIVYNSIIISVIQPFLYCSNFVGFNNVQVFD